MIRPLNKLPLAIGVSVLSLVLGCAGATDQARAQGVPLSLRNTFRIGTGGVICSAQNTPLDPRLNSMFDRGYRLSCRDAAGAVGTMVAVRRAIDIGALPTAMAGTQINCDAAAKAEIAELGTVDAVTCHDKRAGLDYKRYATRREGVSYFVEGLAGYDPALKIAIASVVNGRQVKGEIQVASTEVSDPAAFARVQAGQLDRLDARDEGYQRNNGGRYAESSQFFESLADRSRENGVGLAEALANEGLQQSNLGNFSNADRLFEESSAVIARSDGITQRLLRNYRSINLLNQKRPADALKSLAAQVVPIAERFDDAELRSGLINLPLSDQINRENLSLQRLGGIDPGLTVIERATILDAQAEELAGVAERLRGNFNGAGTKFRDALKQIDSVRSGRVVSASWLRSEIEIEQALLSEASGDKSGAVSAFDRAIATLANSFPQSPAVLAAKARKAGFLSRSGDASGAQGLFAEVVTASSDVQDSGNALRDLLSPYFALLATQQSGDSAVSMFTASQVLQRPGVAQTQAVLARQLSAGNDEAASLFRLSVARGRQIVRAQTEIARLGAIPTPTEQDIQNLNAAKESIASLERDQTGLISKLGAFPRYNVLAPQRVLMTDLQGSLREGEAYYKLMVVGDELYGIFATTKSAQGFKVPITRQQLSLEVQAIRDSVVKIEDGRQVNYPFDVERSRALYHKLFDPIDAQIASVHHLIFEPDGAMLQLPPSVLISTERGLPEYRARIAKPDGDAFDFRGIDWLGRNREMSIAVSPRGFLDIRKLGRSQAPRNYLGIGHNAIPAFRPVTAVADECDWPLGVWQHPISPDELFFAKAQLDPINGNVVTDQPFSDTELLARTDLDQFRIIHFATHGLVSAPRPDCPARPALVTSFGDKTSDGLLTFKEIFDLHLNADLVILSACDTAGKADVAASREAGVTTGGNYALDGLVRAFVGAGARSVIASHWPVPDDFNATKRLIGGVIGAKPDEPLAEALAEAQVKLMDDVNTSHPFYWAAFIILGDGAKPLVSGAGVAPHAATKVATAAPSAPASASR